MGLVKKGSTAAPGTEDTTKEIAHTVKLSYEDSKNLRILTQGIVQAAMQSPGLVGIPYTTVEELAANTKQYSDIMIAYVKEKIGE